LRSKLSQLILITLDHSFQMESISFCERGLRGEISHSYMLSSKQGSIWYYFYNVFGMMQSGIKPTTIHSQGECSTTEPLVWYTCCVLGQLCRKIKLRTRYYLNHFKETLSLAVGFEPLNNTLQHLQTNLSVLCRTCRQTWAYLAGRADKLKPGCCCLLLVMSLCLLHFIHLLLVLLLGLDLLMTASHPACKTHQLGC